MKLDCQLNKPPSLFGIKPRWFKNDLEIIGSQNSKYDLIEEHNICALIIYDLDERDEGRYRCQIGNERTECRIKPEYVLVKYLPNYSIFQAKMNKQNMKITPQNSSGRYNNHRMVFIQHQLRNGIKMVKN